MTNSLRWHLWLLPAAGLLLVLPGSKPHSTMKLNWHDAADAVERINFVYTYEGFMSNWHGYRRYHRCAG
jgi:hypothetical protein